MRKKRSQKYLFSKRKHRTQSKTTFYGTFDRTKIIRATDAKDPEPAPEPADNSDSY